MGKRSSLEAQSAFESPSPAEELKGRAWGELQAWQNPGPGEVGVLGPRVPPARLGSVLLSLNMPLLPLL